MTHYGEGTLRGYLDGEVQGVEETAIARHLEACAQCRAVWERLQAEEAWAGARLESLGDVPADPVEGEAAWRRLRAVWGTAGRRRVARARGWAAASAALAAVVVGTATISPLRAMAANVLQVFRPQQVQVVTVTAQDISEIGAALQSAAASSTVHLQGLAQVHVTQSGKAAQMTLAQARGAVGFDLTAPSQMPAGYSLSTVEVLPAAQVEISGVQVGEINALLASLGDAARLPAAIGGGTFIVQVPASAVLTYTGTAGKAPVRIGESQTPTLEVPADVNMANVRQALLDLPFLPANLRSQLGSVTNWQSTAVVPEVSGVTQGVTVSGSQGLFIQPLTTGKDATLVWMSGGVVRAVRGALTESQANAIARSMA